MIKGRVVVDTQAMCNFDALLDRVLFLYAALSRSEGRTTESVVYLLWSVDRIMCFCEAQSGLCYFLETLMLLACCIQDVVSGLLTFRKKYFGQNLSDAFSFFMLKKETWRISLLLFYLCCEPGIMCIQILVSLPYTFSCIQILLKLLLCLCSDIEFRAVFSYNNDYVYLWHMEIHLHI